MSLACRKAKDLGYPHELWTTRLLARHAQEPGPAEGHPCFQKLSQGTVCKILNEQEIKPHKVRYYLERRDPESGHRSANPYRQASATVALQVCAPRRNVARYGRRHHVPAHACLHPCSCAARVVVPAERGRDRTSNRAGRCAFPTPPLVWSLASAKCATGAARAYIPNQTSASAMGPPPRPSSDHLRVLFKTTAILEVKQRLRARAAVITSRRRSPACSARQCQTPRSAGRRDRGAGRLCEPGRSRGRPWTEA